VRGDRHEIGAPSPRRQVLQHSIQHDHVCVLIEADDRTKLAGALRLPMSIAFAVNRRGARRCARSGSGAEWR